MTFNPESAFFGGFPVKSGVIGQGHIIHLPANPAVKVMVAIQPPVIPDQIRIAFYRNDFPFFLQDHKIAVYGSQTNPFRFRDSVKNLPGCRMIPLTNRLQNQFPLAGVTPV